MRSSGLSCPPLCPRYVAGTNRGSGAPLARPGPACIGLLGTGPPSQAATACPRGLRGLSSPGSLTCRLCLPARSLSPHAGSVLVSAPPPSGALGPRSPAPRVATLPVLAIGYRACLRNHNTASQGHQGSSSRQGDASQEWQPRRRLAGAAGEETPRRNGRSGRRGDAQLRGSKEAPRKRSSPPATSRQQQPPWTPADSRGSDPTGCGLRGAGLCVPTVCLQLLHPCPECGSSMQQFTSTPFGDDRLSCRGTGKQFHPAATVGSYRSLPEGRPPSRTCKIDPQDCDAGSWTIPGAEGQFLVARPTIFHLYQSSAGSGSRTTRSRIAPVAGELVH
ncbi:hypothetical protein NDU88_006768 [Pleurodeles waltl]|uniref:Uncharacterized protein n=1 Tax=Pleurodeles waltl TaxID=8319 RepID=A0AAV7N0D8_PLEWA|nr:hypothetical protein NDU88_006768 [Pleurodeles waltl]